MQSDLVGAEHAFIAAISADRSQLPAHLGLIAVYLYQPQYWQQALAAAQAAEALAPDDPVVVAHLAWAYQLAHRFDEAWDTALRAVELGPESAVAQAALADVLISVYETDLLDGGEPSIKNVAITCYISDCGFFVTSGCH